MEELDLKELLSVFWKKKWIILIIIILVETIGCLYSYFAVVPKYQASTTLILGRINSSSTENQYTEENYNNQITQSEISINSNLVSTYSELIKSKTLIQKVIDNLNINISEEKLRNSITVSRISETELIKIDVINEDENTACNIANEIAIVFSEKVEEIYNISNVYIIDKATPTYIPYNINHFKDICLAFMLGIIISIGYILICQLLDNTIKSDNDIEKTVRLKNLINIPIEKSKRNVSKEELITYLDSKSIVSEAFKTLRTNVQFSNANSKDGKTFLISSCFPSEGKSYVAANLAITFAQIGKKVILVDSDMRRGRQSKIFNVPNSKGLSNYISNLDENGIEVNNDIGTFIRETNIPNLNIVTTGTIPPNPSELLSSPKLVQLVEELKKYYDIIIFDGAPIVPITDSLILARVLHSTILVTLYNKTKKDDVIKVKNNIEAVGGKILGTCINCVPILENNKNKYYYYEEEKKPKIKNKSVKKINFSKFFEKIKNVFKRFIKKSNTIKALPEIKNKINEKKDLSIVEEKSKSENKIEKANESIEGKNEKIKKVFEITRNFIFEKIKLYKEKIAKRVEVTAEKKIERQKNKIQQKKKLQKEKEKLKLQKEEEKKKMQEEQAKIRAEREEERRKLLEEQARIRAEKEIEKKKVQEEQAKIKAEEMAKKRAEQEEIRKKQLEEQERIRIEKEEEKKKMQEEQARVRAEREEERRKLLEEQARIRAEKEIEKKKIQEEQAKIKAEEIAKKKALQEEIRKKQLEEQAILKIKKEEENRKKQLEREREKEEAKYTDEYLEENLYPKTKNTKLF